MGRLAADPATTAEIDRLRADLEAFGASAEQVEAVLAQVGEARAPETFEVLGPNVTAVRLFEAMATQWTMVSLTTLDRARLVPTGLRYEVLDRVARGLGIEERPGDFERIRLMEGEALAAWAEERR